jgi:nicotinamide-nucleotide amidase
MFRKIKNLIHLLNIKKINLSIAESCTGGMLAQTLTSVSGASKIFKFAIVSYSNQSKIRILKVSPKIIKKYGAVSSQCCFAMVNGLSKISKAKLNIAITGIAGPKGGSQLKPVGLVFIGIKKGKKMHVERCLFKNKKRQKIRINSVNKSLELIKKFI